MKKFFAFLLSVLLLLTFHFSFAVSASDVPSSWASEEVQVAISAGFVPEELQKDYTTPITRKEFAKLTVLFAMHELGYDSIDAFSTVLTTVSGPASFLDTDDPYVILAAQMSVAKGGYNGFFDGDRNITREEAAAMLSRVYESYSHLTSSASISFADVLGSDWSYYSIRWCVSANVMKGVSKILFDPKGTYTREQAIITFARMDAIEGWEEWNYRAKIRRKISIDDSIAERLAKGNNELIARYDTGAYGTVIYFKTDIMETGNGYDRYQFNLIGNDGMAHVIGRMPVLARLGKTPPVTKIELLEYNSVLYYEVRYEAYMLGSDSQVTAPGTYRARVNLMTLEEEGEYIKD